MRVKANGINNSGKQVLHVRPVIRTADISYGDIGTGSGTNDFVEGECIQYRTPNRASDNYTKSVKIGKPNIVEAAKSLRLALSTPGRFPACGRKIRPSPMPTTRRRRS